MPKSKNQRKGRKKKLTLRRRGRDEAIARQTKKMETFINHMKEQMAEKKALEEKDEEI